MEIKNAMYALLEGNEINDVIHTLLEAKKKEWEKPWIRIRTDQDLDKAWTRLVTHLRDYLADDPHLLDRIISIEAGTKSLVTTYRPYATGILNELGKTLEKRSDIPQRIKDRVDDIRIALAARRHKKN